MRMSVEGGRDESFNFGSVLSSKGEEGGELGGKEKGREVEGWNKSDDNSVNRMPDLLTSPNNIHSPITSSPQFCHTQSLKFS
jgi:hypothetical protein